MADDNSLNEMRGEAFRRQDNLASDIDELIDRVNPKNAVQRWKNELVQSVKSFTAAGDEQTPAKLPLAIAGGVIGVAVLGVGLIAVKALTGGGDDDEDEDADERASRLVERADKEREKAHQQREKQLAEARKQLEKFRQERQKDWDKAVKSQVRARRRRH